MSGVPLYPLSAVASQPQLQLALALLAVAPSIGGVLIRGDRGAAKSTAARGLAAVMPASTGSTTEGTTGGSAPPFITLPLGATEDRVVGTLDVGAALRGEVRLQRGLLTEADGGLLYIDEVNLLPDHLVDLLLDAAAMGVVRVQRDGLSAEQAARFALIGSMNPEEGQLRPQFLDRFGLCVDVLAPTQASERAEIMRRRVAYEAGPAAFAAAFAPQEAALRERLTAARQRWPGVEMPDALLTRLSDLCLTQGVRSLRGDLVLHRAARAYAALEGRSEVRWDDVLAVAPLVLEHRRSADAPPLPPPPAPNEDSPDPEPPSQPAPPNQPASGPAPEASDIPPEDSSTPDAPSEESGPEESGPEQTSGGNDEKNDSGEVFAPQSLPAGAWGNVAPAGGRGRQVGGEAEGRLLRTVPLSGETGRLHLPATLRSAALGGQRQPGREHLRAPVHERLSGRRVLFVADCSGSVGVSGRMGLVKGAMLAVLAGQGQRDRVALMTFRGSGAEWALGWTALPDEAEAAIRRAPAGGRTPLAHALTLAAERLRTDPAEVVLLTDGRCNVPLTPGGDPWAEALTAAASLAAAARRVTVVDTEQGRVRLRRAAQLAGVMGAELRALDELAGL